MSRIYWDTMLFAYILESNSEFGDRTRAVYEAFQRRGDTICTSVFTLGEILVRPKAVGNAAVYTSIRNFMRGGEIELLPFTFETAEQYSNVRAMTRLKAADAIHAASAIVAQVTIFVTNDHGFRKQEIPGLPMVVGLDGRIF